MSNYLRIPVWGLPSRESQRGKSYPNICVLGSYEGLYVALSKDLLAPCSEGRRVELKTQRNHGVNLTPQRHVGLTLQETGTVCEV